MGEYSNGHRRRKDETITRTMPKDISLTPGVFKKMGQTRPLFCLFSFFSHIAWTNLTINVKSVDGMLGSRTRGGRMEGADESTELWRHPFNSWCLSSCSTCKSLLRSLCLSLTWLCNGSNLFQMSGTFNDKERLEIKNYVVQDFAGNLMAFLITIPDIRSVSSSSIIGVGSSIHCDQMLDFKSCPNVYKSCLNNT